MDKEVLSTVTSIIAKALELPADQVKEDDSIETIEGWDSLGQLNILVALDEKFSGRVSEIAELAKATSVRKIVEILQKHHVV